MIAYTNGMPADQIEAADLWRKARVSQGNGNCVEMRRLDDGRVAVRNSTDPSGPALIFTRSEASAYLDAARDGEFNYVVS